ncbi:MAG: Hsp70 family protein [Planctomycetia bacterium]|nr:Hsp70 family protein [Planctomycetia bacterium]
MIVMGIDFGTTQSKMAVMDEFGRAKPIRNAEGDEITPRWSRSRTARRPSSASKPIARR